MAASCGSSSDDQGARPVAPDGGITVTSPAFDDGGAIPTRFTCDGEEVSPGLHWSGVPAGTSSVAIVVDDPDAPNGGFTHWVVTGIDPSTTKLAEGASPPGQAAPWKGPCPPSGTHRYRFVVYAMQRDVDASVDEILAFALDRGVLTGTYSRQ